MKLTVGYQKCAGKSFFKRFMEVLVNWSLAITDHEAAKSLNNIEPLAYIQLESKDDCFNRPLSFAQHIGKGTYSSIMNTDQTYDANQMFIDSAIAMVTKFQGPKHLINN